MVVVRIATVRPGTLDAPKHWATGRRPAVPGVVQPGRQRGETANRAVTAVRQAAAAQQVPGPTRPGSRKPAIGDQIALTTQCRFAPRTPDFWGGRRWSAARRSRSSRTRTSRTSRAPQRQGTLRPGAGNDPCGGAVDAAWRSLTTRRLPSTGADPRPRADTQHRALLASASAESMSSAEPPSRRHREPLPPTSKSGR